MPEGWGDRWGRLREEGREEITGEVLTAGSRRARE